MKRATCLVMSACLLLGSIALTVFAAGPYPTLDAQATARVATHIAGDNKTATAAYKVADTQTAAAQPTATNTPVPPTNTPVPTNTPTPTPNTLACTQTTGTDSAQNHYVACTVPLATVTGGTVTLPATAPELDFECPTSGASADPNNQAAWTVVKYWLNPAVGTYTSTVGCAQQVTTVRWIVDYLYPTPTNPIVRGSGSATPTPTPVPPTPTPLPGLVCGGVNDTTLLQNALNGGGTVTLAAGTCVIAQTLTYGSSTTLAGAGQDVTTIRNSAAHAGAIMLQPAMNRAAHFTIKNLTMDATPAPLVDNTFTVSANGTTYFTSDHVTYRNVMMMAVWTDGAGVTATDHLTISFSRVTEAQGDGFSFFGQITDSSITDSEVANCNDDGIALQENVAAYGPTGYPARWQILRNSVHDCTTRNAYGSTANGINTYGSDEVTVSDNVIRNVVSCGLNLEGGINRRATNQHAYRNSIDHAGYNHLNNPGVPPYGIKIENADNVDGGGNTIINTDFLYRNMGSTNVTGFPWPST